MGDTIASGEAAIFRDKFLFGGNAGLRSDSTLQRVPAGHIEVKGYAGVGQISQWMAKGGKLPVQQRHHPGFRRVKEHIFHTIITMDDAGGIACGYIAGQIFHQFFHGGDFIGFGGHILLGPASDLTSEVIARFAVIFQPQGLVFHRVQSGQNPDHIQVDRPSFLHGHVGQGEIRQNPTADVFHHEKGDTDDRFIFAQQMHAGYRNVGFFQCLHDAKLTFDHVG